MAADILTIDHDGAEKGGAPLTGATGTSRCRIKTVARDSRVAVRGSS
jgi:hypothetical protein